MSEATKKDEQVCETDAIRSMNIFQRVAAITAELGTVAKNLSVKAGGGSYKAVSERDIIDAVKPLEAKYRVYSYPSDRVILESETLESESEYNGKVTKKTTFFTRMQTTYTFINIDNPGEMFSTIVFSEGIDPGDKGSGKGMTYADKYALMKAYKISTGDDPDQNPTEETRYTRTGRSNQNQNQNQNRNQQAPALFTCTKCGRPIQDTKRTDGTVMTASEVAYYSSQRFGAALCPNCQREITAKRGQM